MKRSAALAIGILCLTPLVASAQAATQVSTTMLEQLQSLQAEVSSLEKTLESIIALVTGAPAPSSSAPSSTGDLRASIAASTISNPPSFSANTDDTTDLADQLMQALAPTISTSTIVVAAPATSTPAEGATSTPPNTSAIANQTDPACISSIFSNGQQCGGLYWCGSIGSGLWSSQACTSP
ncbi:MAG TPA: hypothetical protein VMU27_01350 [Candidatus Paceibacterota bacterium]|nr:hypothetical protein [Candidatus Paceibacterota bacterium]